jgi:hypothetical protein
VNGWDVLTYLCSAGLGVSAVVIFGFFLRDARELLQRPGDKDDD